MKRALVLVVAACSVLLPVRVEAAEPKVPSVNRTTAARWGCVYGIPHIGSICLTDPLPL